MSDQPAAAASVPAGPGASDAVEQPSFTSNTSTLQVTLSQFQQMAPGFGGSINPPAAAPSVYEPGPPAQSPQPTATSLSATSPHQRTTPAFPLNAAGGNAFMAGLAPLSTSRTGTAPVKRNPSHPPVFSPIVNSPHALNLSANHAKDWTSMQQERLQNERQAADTYTGSTPLRCIYPSLIPDNATQSFPPFLRAIYSSSRRELSTYDELIRAKVLAELNPRRMRDVCVVVGVPFYTESSNIHSVLITMRDVFQLRRQRALFIIMGEHARQDCIATITDCAEIERGESWEKESFVAIETMVKPHAKYASKPWTVRALQIIASMCGPSASAPTSASGGPQTPTGGDDDGEGAHIADPLGAHLLIMDADIQFNHWELSAQSLVSSLLDPLQGWDVARDRAQGIEAAPVTEDGAAPVEINHVPTPPMLQSRLQPLYPSPLPLTLVRGGQGDGLADTASASTTSSAGASVSAPSSSSLSSSCSSSDADPDPEAPLAQTTFSPVFAVRSPDGYPDSPSEPLVPKCCPDLSNTKTAPPAATFVVLNAPRSFFADDAIVHLVSYLHTAMSLGLEVHQAHGGEFSMHRDLNRAFLRDDSIVYDRAYCVEAQMAHRAAFVHPRERPELFPSLRLGQLDNHVREAVLASGCSVLEVLMKGKWHAKITLNKLLAFEAEPAQNANSNAVLHAGSKLGTTTAAAVAAAATSSEGSSESGATPAGATPSGTTPTVAPTGTGVSSAAHNPSYPGPALIGGAAPRGSRARIDLVSEKLFNESMYWSTAGLSTPKYHSSVPLLHHTGGPHYVPNPDPKAQSLRVLAPTSARKQMVRSLKLYTQALLVEHVQVEGGGNLPASSRFLSRLLPALQRLVSKRRSTDACNYIVSYVRASTHPDDPWHPSRIDPKEREQFVVFGPHEWSEYTVELLHLYKQAAAPEQRRAVLCAHRLVWLLGCTALLNDHSHCLWGHMHSTMHQVYAPVFRRKYLTQFLHVPSERVKEMMREEMGDCAHQHQSPSPQPLAATAMAASSLAQPTPTAPFAATISAIAAH